VHVPSLTCSRLVDGTSKQPEPRQLLRQVVILVAAILSLALASACGQSSGGSAPARHYADAAVGKARLMRDATPRITRVVDVRAAFSDEVAVRGAVVLIDQRVGGELPEEDFRRRPLLVRYASVEAARQAALNDSFRANEIRERDVLYLPRHFPARAEKDYRHAMYVGYQ
jgi:hypothetical protein